MCGPGNSLLQPNLRAERRRRKAKIAVRLGNVESDVVVKAFDVRKRGIDGGYGRIRPACTADWAMLLFL